MSPHPDLSVRLGPLALPNPVLVASGTFGYGSEAGALPATYRLGGLVTKTITLEPRSGNPPPRLCQTPAGLLNSIGLQNVGVDRFRREKLPRLVELDLPLVVSIGGRRSEDFAEVVRQLDREAGIAAYEINISCPNVREGGLEFCRRPEGAAEVVAEVRAATELPIWAKLSPNVGAIGALARNCADAGADGLTAVNTFLGLAIDPRTRRPELPAGTAGLSGPAIRPLALAKVREVVEAVSIPVIGVGGITTAPDALQFLIAGARAVQIGTASFREPDAAARVVSGIERFLEAERLSGIEELIGSYRPPEGGKSG